MTMSNITSEAVQAFVNGTTFKGGNTTVSRNTHDSACVSLKLHGHTIAQRIGDRVRINDCGWKTRTTKDRLNGVIQAYHARGGIFQKNFEWYLEIDEVVEFPSNEWVTI